jgi:hypothetical protein
MADTVFAASDREPSALRRLMKESERQVFCGTAPLTHNRDSCARHYLLIVPAAIDIHYFIELNYYAISIGNTILRLLIMNV